MEIGPFSPEEIIDSYSFSSDLSSEEKNLLKILLTNYFNRLTLEHYRLHRYFLSPLEIYKKIPFLISEFSSSPSFWSLREVFREDTAEFPEEGTIRVPESDRSLKLLVSIPSSPKTDPKPARTYKNGTSWVSNSETVGKFTEFIKSHYETSPEPNVKISDLLKAFSLDSGTEVGSSWNNLGVKVGPIPNPRYPASTGTYHAYLIGKI
jgi:hypothetical protein